MWKERASAHVSVSGQGPFQCQKGIIRKGRINRSILRHKPDQQKVREAVTRTKPGQSLYEVCGMWECLFQWYYLIEDLVKWDYKEKGETINKIQRDKPTRQT